MSNEEKAVKNQWGGARTGAGRPKSVDSVKSIALRIPADVAEILDRQPNRSAFIIEAIRHYDCDRRKHSL